MTKKVVWAVIAVMLIGAILVIGTGTGGNATNQTNLNALLPLLLATRLRVLPDPRR